jgi:hypothetical protein
VPAAGSRGALRARSISRVFRICALKLSSINLILFLPGHALFPSSQFSNASTAQAHREVKAGATAVESRVQQPWEENFPALVIGSTFIFS